MNIEIKPGKWRMRNGKRAIVEYKSECPGHKRWKGYIDKEPIGYFMSWYDDGKAILGDGHDLIEPWIEKPVVDWDAMPAWAKWVAMEKDGRWFWYTHKPSEDANGHLLDAGWCHGITREFYPTFTGNWRDSLVERPSS